MGTIADKLLYLDGTKTALRDAINQAGGYLTTADPFRDYVDDWLRSQSATLSLEFWCERFMTRRRGGMAENALGFANIITFTRASSGGVFNEYGQYVSLATNVWRPDHDPASVTTSTSTVDFDSLTATFTLPSGHAFQVGDKFRATAVAGSLWGVVVARTDTTATVHVRNSTTTGSASSWTCIKPRGILIEEQRTNLHTYSSDFTHTTWVKYKVSLGASVLSPAGTTTGTTLVEDTTNDIHGIYKTTLTYAASSSFAHSWVVKRKDRRYVRLYVGTATNFTYANSVTYDLQTNTVVSGVGSIEVLRDGWVRLSRICTSSATGPSTTINLAFSDSPTNFTYTGDGVSGLYIWEEQFEVGSFPTSIIPAVASQVTRSADVASVNTLSPWYNASEGTIVASFAEGLGSYPPVLTLDDGTGNNRFYIYRNAASATQSTRLAADGSAAGVSIFNSLSPTETGDGTLAFAYANNSFALVFKGGAVVTDNSGAVPTNTTLSIGNNTPTGRKLNGHIQFLEYYPRRLSNTELQEITA